MMTGFMIETLFLMVSMILPLMTESVMTSVNLFTELKLNSPITKTHNATLKPDLFIVNLADVSVGQTYHFLFTRRTSFNFSTVVGKSSVPAGICQLNKTSSYTKCDRATTSKQLPYVLPFIEGTRKKDVTSLYLGVAGTGAYQFDYTIQYCGSKSCVVDDCSDCSYWSGCRDDVCSCDLGFVEPKCTAPDDGDDDDETGLTKAIIIILIIVGCIVLCGAGGGGGYYVWVKVWVPN